MSEFIIVFREVLEASLVVGIIYLILEKSNQVKHFSKLWLGVAAAIIASICVGYIVILAKSSIGNDACKDGDFACFEAIGTIGNGSCHGYKACHYVSRNIENFECIGPCSCCEKECDCDS